MHVKPGFHNGAEHIMGGIEIVVYSIALAGAVAHGIGRGALLGEMDDGLGPHCAHNLQKPVIFAGNVHHDEINGIARSPAPCGKARLHGKNGRKRLQPQVHIYFSARKIINNNHMITMP